MNQPYYGNQYSYGYGGYQPAVSPAYSSIQPTTNKIYVTSLEDALTRYASPNSTMVYVLQDESTFFEIYTDPQGKKVPKVKKLVDFTPEPAPGNDFVSRAEFDELKSKLKSLIDKGGENT